MISLLRKLYGHLVPLKVYALVGRSGTGKSFRAQSVAKKYRIPLIIDDGLLIRGDKIVAGKSAKQESNFLTAVKCAVFKNDEHREEVIKALDHEVFHKILIIGTSDNMTSKIAAVLNLPEPKVIIHIEDIASKEEIDTAMKIRFIEGKHVIPVAPLQIARNYPGIIYDGVRNITANTEKTLVRPEFSKAPEAEISEAAMKQMISQSLYEYGNTVRIESVSFTKSKSGYNINVALRTPRQFDSLQKTALQNHISDSLEKYGGILVNSINADIHEWA